jgi:hypothetical protein
MDKSIKAASVCAAVASFAIVMDDRLGMLRARIILYVHHNGFSSVES